MVNTASLSNSVDPLLVFGGPYSNLEATRAMLAEAERLGVPPARTYCTGDLVAYCGSPVETIELVRNSKIHVVMGNCDEQLANGAGDCGCGYPEGSLCERLSSTWFALADARIDDRDRRWLGQLPRRIDVGIGGRRLTVIHGAVNVINAFVFATTPAAVKHRELDLVGCDGIIGGHSGLPFTDIVDGRLWHNAGVIGMPANDGTPRVWFSLISPCAEGLKIEHRVLDYDHARAATAMAMAKLPPEYRISLSTGIWPSCDVLPPREASRQGTPLEATTIYWNNTGEGASRSELAWPSFSVETVDRPDESRLPYHGRTHE